jgi:putative toxin-antitoxin system antitoxin component (TIGR02293 family)
MAHATLIPVSQFPSASFDWRSVERGVPLSALEEFSNYSGIPLKELLEVVIPLRTLKHRRQRKEPLNLEESDRLGRVARIYELAVHVYGDREDGKEWLLEPKDRFDHKS